MNNKLRHAPLCPQCGKPMEVGRIGAEGQPESYECWLCLQVSEIAATMSKNSGGAPQP